MSGAQRCQMRHRAQCGCLARLQGGAQTEIHTAQAREHPGNMSVQSARLQVLQPHAEGLVPGPARITSDLTWPGVLGGLHPQNQRFNTSAESTRVGDTAGSGSSLSLANTRAG